MLPDFMHLPLSAGYILAGLFSCKPGPAPDVTLHFQNNPPVISHAKSSAYLMDFRKNATSPNYGSAFPILDGLTNGKIQLKYELAFTGTEEKRSHQACVAASAAHLVLTYTPTVYISSEIPDGSCRHGVTLQHEMKHVRTDIDTIEEYIPAIKAAAIRGLRHAQTAQPVDSRNVDDTRNKILAELAKELDEQTTDLEKTRTSRQQRIDSRAEYEGLSHACAGERRR